MALDRVSASQFKKDPKIVSFTYHSKRSHNRSNSFCIVTFEDKTNETYTKNKILGSGSYGQVSYFEPANKLLKPLAVKEFFPEKFGDSDSAICNTVNKLKSQCTTETIFTQKMNGFALDFHTNEAVHVRPVIVENKQLLALTHYPHAYMLMDYVDGTLFENFKITSVQTYLSLYQAALVALKELHNKKIIHRDISSTNIFICIDENNRYKICFIDPSLSQTIGEKFSTWPKEKYLLHPNFPPEMFADAQPPNAADSEQPLIAAHPAQDIYLLGQLFKNSFERISTTVVFPPRISQAIQAIHNNIFSTNPDQRASVNDVLRDLYAIESKEPLLNQIKQKQTELEKHFDDNQAIDRWCYCEGLLFELKTRNPNQVDLVANVQIGYDKVSSATSSTWDITLGARRLKENCIYSNPDNLATILSNMKHPQQRILLLQHLHESDESYLANFAKRDISRLLKIIPEKDRKSFWQILFQSMIFALTKTIEIASSDTKDFYLDQWCYCERFLIQEAIDSFSYLEDAARGWQLLQNNWQPGYGLQRLKDWLTSDANYLVSILHKTDDKYKMLFLRYLSQKFLNLLFANESALLKISNLLSDKDKREFILFLGNEFIDGLKVHSFKKEQMGQFVALIESVFDTQSADGVIKNFADQILFNSSSMQTACQTIDKLKTENDNDLYKRFLLALNQLYRDNRKTNPHGQHFTSFGMSLFGRYSMDDKLLASTNLENDVIQGKKITNLSGAAASGDLGEIGKRLATI